jgi:hypothetical protein
MYLKIFKVLFKKVPINMVDEWHLHIFNLHLFKAIIGDKFSIVKKSGIPFFWLPLRYVIKVIVYKNKI